MDVDKDYGSWSLAALKAELKKRNAKLTGKKAVLVQRLKDYDQLFGPTVNEPENCYQIEMPQIQEFRDVNSESKISPLKEEDLGVYCLITERENLLAGQQMYQEGFLLTARTASSENNIFLLATCASQLRKQVSYKVVIKYETNAIKECQCECAAGMGPHAQCKHVIMVLYALIDFTKTKSIRTRPSCTASLQTFNHPSKFYTGQPVEAQNLILKQKNRRLSTVPEWNPLPSTEMSNEKYVEHFNNEVKNFCATEKITMPISQLTIQADKKALFREHDYLEKTCEEEFLESLVLNENDLQKLEIETRNDQKKWKLQRLRRLQSSNFGKICKSKPENRKKLAKSLLKNIEILTPAIKHGLKYENKAVKEFSRRTGVNAEKCGIIVHPEMQYIASTPDRLIGEDAVLEVKCPFTGFNKPISSETVDYLYLCEETGNFKLKQSHDYYYQIQGQLLCSNRKRAYFVVYTIADMCIINIERDNTFTEEMLGKLKLFYNEYYREQFLNRHFYDIKI